MYVPKKSLQMNHVNLVFTNKKGATLNIDFDADCEFNKDHLCATQILIEDIDNTLAEDSAIFDEDWINDEKYLEVLAGFFGKKVIDKDETPVKGACSKCDRAWAHPESCEDCTHKKS